MRMTPVHILQICNHGIAICTIIVQAKIVGRVSGHKCHPFVDPILSILVVRAGWTDQLLFIVPEGQHVGIPEVSCMLGCDASTLGLVEEVNDWFIGLQDVLPILTAQLSFEMDHGPERCSVLEFRRDPGVPVTDRLDDLEVHLVHHAWDTSIAGSLTVGPIPE